MKKDITDLFQNATVTELKLGYVHDPSDDQYVCLICGDCYERGVIYADDDGSTGLFFEAEKKMKRHIKRDHQSMFHHLIELDKKRTGLTDLQKELISMFHDGLSDADIVKKLGGSSSTVRNHRFTMREKMKQAKLFLALMEMMEEHNASAPKLVPVPVTANMVDERYVITEQEREGFLNQYFPDGWDGRLTGFPKKEKRKIVILRNLAERFERGRLYTEKDINAVLKEAYHDYVTLRRYMIDYGLLDRKEDGSQYWLK
ncbi:DUF2087 domain-containing protein [Paenibacillus sp. ACRRX]|uniref:DUF2087 domain-containing protein n=1 Tax=Paenibacillus sp. ACRRX TaxID=2918206 RepID=UPI001EF56C3E|nr:DUF2087 domain-containing protein [Paenibacillus sp. ACRRX]MCG7408154.1 DUF2087 domain-containing protein [Paenibacillus sp. ACRRX]